MMRRLGDDHALFRDHAVHLDIQESHVGVMDPLVLNCHGAAMARMSGSRKILAAGFLAARAFSGRPGPRAGAISEIPDLKVQRIKQACGMKAVRSGFLALLATMLLASCDNSKMRSVAAENARLKAELNRLENDLSEVTVEKHIRDAEHEERARMEREMERLQSEIKSLEGLIRDQEIEAEKQRAEFDKYKDRYRASVRAKAVGTTLGDVECAGQTYRSTKISKVDDLGISVTHLGGVARLDFARLPVELQMKFGYESEVARKVRAEQAESRKKSALARAKASEKQSVETVRRQTRDGASQDRTSKRLAIDKLEIEIRKQKDAITTLRDQLRDNEYGKYSSTVYRIRTAPASSHQLRGEIKRLSDWVIAAESRLERMRDSYTNDY